MTALTATDRALLREAFTYARAEGWRRMPDCGDDDVPAWGWKWGGRNADDVPARYAVFAADVYDGEPYIALTTKTVDESEVRDIRHAVDLLVVDDLLPVRLSSAYRAGRNAGIDEIANLLDAVEQFPDGYTLDQTPDLPIDDIMAGALSWLRFQASDLEAGAAIGNALDGLLDRHPYVRREQLADVLDAVFEPLDKLISDERLAARQRRMVAFGLDGAA